MADVNITKTPPRMTTWSSMSSLTSSGSPRFRPPSLSSVGRKPSIIDEIDTRQRINMSLRLRGLQKSTTDAPSPPSTLVLLPVIVKKSTTQSPLITNGARLPCSGYNSVLLELNKSNGTVPPRTGKTLRKARTIDFSSKSEMQPGLPSGMSSVSETMEQDDMFAEQNGYACAPSKENICATELDGKSPGNLLYGNDLKIDGLIVKDRYLYNVNDVDCTDSVFDDTEVETGLGFVNNNLLASSKYSGKYNSTMFLFPTTEDSSTPCSTVTEESVLYTLTISNKVECTSTVSDTVVCTPTASDTVQCTPTASDTVQSTFTTSDMVQYSSTTSHTVQPTATTSDMVQSSLTTSDTFQSIPTTSNTVQSIPTTSDTVQGTSTTGDTAVCTFTQVIDQCTAIVEIIIQCETVEAQYQCATDMSNNIITNIEDECPRTIEDATQCTATTYTNKCTATTDQCTTEASCTTSTEDKPQPTTTVDIAQFTTTTTLDTYECTTLPEDVQQPCTGTVQETVECTTLPEDVLQQCTRTVQDAVECTLNDEKSGDYNNLEVIEEQSFSSSVEAGNPHDTSVVSSEAPSEQDTSEDSFHTAKEFESCDELESTPAHVHEAVTSIREHEAVTSIREHDAVTNASVWPSIAEETTTLRPSEEINGNIVSPIDGFTYLSNSLQDDTIDNLQRNKQRIDEEYIEENNIRQNYIIINTPSHDTKVDRLCAAVFERDQSEEHLSREIQHFDVDTNPVENNKNLLIQLEEKIRPLLVGNLDLLPDSDSSGGNPVTISEELLDNLSPVSLLFNTTETTSAANDSGMISEAHVTQIKSNIQVNNEYLHEADAGDLELNTDMQLTRLDHNKDLTKLKNSSMVANVVDPNNIIEAHDSLEVLSIDRVAEEELAMLPIDGNSPPSVELPWVELPCIELPCIELPCVEIPCVESLIESNRDLEFLECPVQIVIEAYDEINIAQRCSSMDLQIENIISDCSKSTNNELIHRMDDDGSIVIEKPLQKRVRFSFDEVKPVKISDDLFQVSITDTPAGLISSNITKDGWNVNRPNFEETPVLRLYTNPQDSDNDPLNVLKSTSNESLSHNNCLIMVADGRGSDSKFKENTDKDHILHETIKTIELQESLDLRANDTSVMELKEDQQSEIQSNKSTKTEPTWKRVDNKKQQHLDEIDSNGLPNSEERKEQIEWQTIEVEIEKGVTGLGFCITGGADSVLGKSPVSVKRIFNGSTDAQRVLKAGDELLRIGEHDISASTQSHALQVLKSLPKGTIQLTIRRQVYRRSEEKIE